MSDTRDVIATWSASGHPVGLFDYSLADELLAALAAAGKKVVDVGEVVPAADVLDLARQWDEYPGDSTTGPEYHYGLGHAAAELRALVRPAVEQGGPGAHADGTGDVQD